MNKDVMGTVVDLIFGRWRSQILFTGAHLGVFDQLSASEARSAEATAAAIGTDPTMTYRLLRALGSLGLLAEDDALGSRPRRPRGRRGRLRGGRPRQRHRRGEGDHEGIAHGDP